MLQFSAMEEALDSVHGPCDRNGYFRIGFAIA